MSTIGSSFINKSGKKFLPKAPGGRRRPDPERHRTSSQPLSSVGDPSAPGTPYTPQDTTSSTAEAQHTENGQLGAQEQNAVVVDAATAPIVSVEEDGPRTSGGASEQENVSRDNQRGASEQVASRRSRRNIGKDTGPRESVEVEGDTSGVATRASRRRAESIQRADPANVNGISAQAEEEARLLHPLIASRDSETTVERDNTSARTNDNDAQTATESSPSNTRRKRGAQPTQRAPAAKRRKARNEASAITNNANDQAGDYVPESTTPVRQSIKRGRKEKSTAAASSAQNGIQQDSQDGQTVEEAASESPKKKRRRAATPEGAEDMEIDPLKTTMQALTKDQRMGKTSAIEARMREIDWAEVKQRRREADEREEREALERINGADNYAQDTVAEEEDGDEAQRNENAVDVVDNPETSEQRVGPTTGPRLKLVNGQMVIDNDSLTVDRHATADAAAALTAPADEIEEDELTARVNSHSYLTSHRRDPRERRAHGTYKSDPWGISDTERFYDALRMCGTDFFLMSQLLPGKSRRQCKTKFVREEKENEEKVKQAVTVERIPLDLSRFEEANGKEEGYFRDPGEVREELKKLEDEQREEIERKRREEEEAARQKQEAAAARMAAGKQRGAKKNTKTKQANVGSSGSGTTAKKGRRSKKQITADASDAASRRVNDPGNEDAQTTEAAEGSNGAQADNTETIEVEGEALS